MALIKFKLLSYTRDFTAEGAGATEDLLLVSSSIFIKLVSTLVQAPCLIKLNWKELLCEKPHESDEAARAQCNTYVFTADWDARVLEIFSWY